MRFHRHAAQPHTGHGSKADGGSLLRCQNEAEAKSPDRWDLTLEIDKHSARRKIGHLSEGHMEHHGEDFL